MTQELRVGWIGCGRMGAAMAKRLLVAGRDVTVTNRTRAKAEALEEFGAHVVDRPYDLASCDVVFVMVSADADLVEVVLGDHGVLTDDGAVPQIIIDCSTVSTGTSASVRDACATRGVEFLAAPVSGNAKVVTSGKLTLAVSGSRDVFDEARPLLDQLGRGVTYVGDGEVARLVKICHNIFLGIVTQAMAEITVLAERGGIERSALLEFLNDSVMGSTFTRYKTPAFVNLDFKVTFTPTLLRKDMDLGLDAGREFGVPLPLASLTRDLIQTMIGNGMTEQDFATLLMLQAKSSGIELKPENAKIDDGLS
jgi:3-hydroxyisobutyrate dehydrogenase-like beta-hydroxyacid dehydrogenase